MSELEGKKILITVGTRPNFIKVTQFKRLAESYPNLDIRIAHTGQHYDKNMSQVFFDQFDCHPDFFLNANNEDAIRQKESIQTNLKTLLSQEFQADLIIVPGDVNSTLYAAEVAQELGIPLAHLEAGLRSFDPAMPEEHNRIETDKIADHLFVTEQSGLDNIESENLTAQVHFVGNTMIDSLCYFESEIDKANVPALDKVEEFGLVTIHRPSNVDTKEQLTKVVEIMRAVSQKMPIVWPLHPRTKKNLEHFELESEIYNNPNIHITEALGYFEFQKLLKSAHYILTDSGGIQEETTFRQIPCITLRNNTERPITTSIGTNTLCELDVNKVIALIDQILDGEYKKGSKPELWDGRATERILAVLNQII